ncbi:MAG: glycosyltransferase family 4 protein [Sphingomonadaceae bacterium]|nr:glycosyltransferase family 4 protein [Sphingomonadaceae bacterium]
MREDILFLGPWPPPFGGIASNIFELMPGLVASGYAATTLSYTTGADETSISRPYVTNIRFKPTAHLRRHLPAIVAKAWRGRRHRKGLSIGRFLRAVTIAHKVEQVARAQASRFIFTYDNEQLHAVPFIDRDSAGFPKIFATIYTGFILFQDEYRDEMAFLRHAIASADVILSCSDYCLRSGQTFLGIEYPGRVLYNNVDHHLYNPQNDGAAIRARFGIADDAIVLMTMARMDRDMGYDFLVDNLDAILAIDPRIVVLLVGASGPMSATVQAAADRYPRVHCAFDISFDDKPAFFAACDIFTAPSREAYACLGIANIEAMMTAKAVLSSTSGGHVETIEDGVTGALVPFVDGKLDRDAYLRHLAAMAASPELRRRYGEAGRERGLRMFTNDKIVADHIRVITDSM